MATNTKSALKGNKSKKVSWEFPLNRKNFIIALVALGVTSLGFIFMWTGVSEDPATVDGAWNNFWAVSAAPFLLVVGYCILIPFALLKFFKGEKQKEA